MGTGMSAREIDWGLYLVTDRGMVGDRALAEVVPAAVEGGVGAVQLREKELSTREFIEEARRLRQVLRPLGVPLIVNDRVDVAWAAGADGVHIGQSDMPYADARKLLGPDALIGVSVESMDQFAELESCDLAYLALSPIYTTPTKTDTITEWGLEGIRAAREHTRHRLIGIGGLNRETVAAPIRNGLDGAAVVSAICRAVNPRAAAEELAAVIREARR